jgi:hypothetical protein
MTDMHLNDEAPIRIEWADFQPMLELIRKPRNDVLLGGVYAWGFEVDGIFLLWYVGKANVRTSIQTRLRDHFMLLIGGSYTIPSCFFREGEAFDLQKPSTAMISWDLDHDFPHSKMLHDLSTLIPIITAGHKFASQILVSVGRVISDDSPVLSESSLLKLIESKLIFSLQPLINKRSKSTDVPIRLLNSGNPWTAKWQTDLSDHRDFVAELRLAIARGFKDHDSSSGPPSL